MQDFYEYQGLNLKNRIIRAATNDYCGNTDGTISAQQMHLYNTLAKSGIGMIITGNFYINQAGQLDSTQNAIDASFDTRGAAALTEMIHRYESKVVFQIAHAGTKTKISQAISEKYKDTSSLSDQNLDFIIKDFVSAAKRTQSVNADGVQIHFGHGYLLSQILSQRTDGVSIAACLLCEMRKTLGQYPILVKMNSDLNEATRFAFYKLCDEYEIWAIELSGSDFPAKKATEHLYYIDEIDHCRANCHTPIILTGGIRSLSDMNEALCAGASLVGMSRPFICDPSLLLSFNERPSDCISCNRCFDIYPKEYRHCFFRQESKNPLINQKKYDIKIK